MNPTQVKEKMRTYIRSELIRRPDYPLTDDEGLITGGLIDSFSLAQLGVFIEDEFGVFIPDTELTVANMDTLNQMVARILAETDSSNHEK
jgi:acyl carrier protein